MTTVYKFYKNSNTEEVIMQQIFSSTLLKFSDCYYDRNCKQIFSVDLTGFVEIKEKTFKREIKKS